MSAVTDPLNKTWRGTAIDGRLAAVFGLLITLALHGALRRDRLSPTMAIAAARRRIPRLRRRRWSSSASRATSSGCRASRSAKADGTPDDQGRRGSESPRPRPRRRPTLDNPDDLEDPAAADQGKPDEAGQPEEPTRACSTSSKPVAAEHRDGRPVPCRSPAGLPACRTTSCRRAWRSAASTPPEVRFHRRGRLQERHQAYEDVGQQLRRRRRERCASRRAWSSPPPPKTATSRIGPRRQGRGGLYGNLAMRGRCFRRSRIRLQWSRAQAADRGSPVIRLSGAGIEFPAHRRAARRGRLRRCRRDALQSSTSRACSRCWTWPAPRRRRWPRALAFVAGVTSGRAGRHQDARRGRGQIEGRLYVTARRYGPARRYQSDLRDAVHDLANDIVKSFTGQAGVRPRIAIAMSAAWRATRSRLRRHGRRPLAWSSRRWPPTAQAAGVLARRRRDRVRCRAPATTRTSTSSPRAAAARRVSKQPGSTHGLGARRHTSR